MLERDVKCWLSVHARVAALFASRRVWRGRKMHLEAKFLLVHPPLLQQRPPCPLDLHHRPNRPTLREFTSTAAGLPKMTTEASTSAAASAPAQSSSSSSYEPSSTFIESSSAYRHASSDGSGTRKMMTTTMRSCSLSSTASWTAWRTSRTSTRAAATIPTP